MSKKTAFLIRRIYGVVLSVALIVTGVLLMISCVNIYKSGPRPFTPESISAAFSKIAVFVWVTVGAVILGIILALLFPAEQGKPRVIRQKKATLRQLQSRLNTDLCDAECLASIRKEEKRRTVLRISSVIACVLVSVPAAVYALDLDHFILYQDGVDMLNASVISACLWVIPATLICLGICIAFSYLEEASLDRQISLVKGAIAKTGAFAPQDEPAKPTRPKLVWCIRGAILLVALTFIVLGICNGGMADVLSKAINICTECIGLG